MILANLTKAIREQNYYAVVLEFLIVIAGVVIGFQITGWADEQSRLARSDQMTQRLLDDLEDEHWRMTASIRYLEDVASEAGLALAAIEGRTELSDEALVIKTFRGTQYFGATLNRATYDELLNRAELDLITSQELRTRVAEYYTVDPGLILAEVEETPLRRYLRRHISPELHAALVRSCQEDPDIMTGDYGALENFLSYSCTVEDHDVAIAELASLIRDDETYRELLKVAIIDAEQAVFNVSYYWATLNRVLELGGREIP